MQYLGGKFQIRKSIADFLESVRNGRDYLEPFCGGCWVTQEMTGVRYASDYNKCLITMYKALQNGWIPPEIVSETMYDAYKNKQDPEDPMTAFVGIACSFGGKWFGGYARNATAQNYALSGRRSLLRQIAKVKTVVFSYCNYSDYSPTDMLIYCDPPYAGTTGYSGVPAFDSAGFWDIMRQWSKRNVVVVSEFSAPSDFESVASFAKHTAIRGVSGKVIPVVDHLFMYKDGMPC